MHHKRLMMQAECNRNSKSVSARLRCNGCKATARFPNLHARRVCSPDFRRHCVVWLVILSTPRSHPISKVASHTIATSPHYKHLPRMTPGFETRSSPNFDSCAPVHSTSRFAHPCRSRPRGSILVATLAPSLLPLQLYLLSRKSF